MENYSNLLFFILITLFKHCISLDYIPPSRAVDAHEGCEYTFGFNETGDTNIISCTYSSDTGIMGTFEVVKPEIDPEQETRVEHNEIVNWGKIGRCQITIRYIDDKGPSSWTLQPVDKDPNKRLPSTTFKVNFFYKVPLLSNKINVYESASFFQYLNTSQNFVECKLKYSNTEITLSMNSNEIKNVFMAPYSEEDEDVSKRIKSLGRGRCGFQLNAAKLTDAFEWYLTATDSENRHYRAAFKSVIFKKEDDSFFNQKKIISLGESQTISCGQEYDQSFCLFYNPQGKLIQSDGTCSFLLNSISMSDIGKWKCATGSSKIMESADYTVETFNGGDEKIESWVNETDNYLQLGCKITNYDFSAINYCRMISPNKSVYNLRPGAATGRYVALGTDFSNNVCSMEIEKPLREHEDGVWRCEIGVSGKQITGAFLQVGQVTVPDYPRYVKVNAQLNKPVEITCEVPYSSDYCHIKAPNGTIFSTKDQYQMSLGKCSLKIQSSTRSDNGTWVCSFAREMGVPDEQIFVEVTVGEVLSYYSTINADVGDKVVILCSTNGLPLNYCRFTSPSGQTYHIHNHGISDYLSYYGKGIEYGDCGIVINLVKISDQGKWMCATRIGSKFKQEEISATITLEIIPDLLDDPNVAAAVGISIGVVILSTIVGFIAIRKWRRRSHSEIQGSSTAERSINMTEYGSDADIFDIGAVSRSYTNPQLINRDNERGHEHQT